MAVKTTRWTGGTSTDWDTASNWSNGVPSTTEKDSVYVAREATGDLLLNIDRTGDDVGGVNYGADFTVFEIEEGCTVNVGTASSSLKITADNVYIRGGGSVYYDSVNGSLGTNLTDNLVVDAPGAGVWLDFTDGPTQTDLLAGVIVVRSANGGTAFGLRLGYSAINPSSGPHVTLSIGSDGVVTPIYANAGKLILDSTEINMVPSRVVNSGASVELKNLSFILDYIQTSGITTATSSQQLQVATDFILMGGVFDTRSFQSAFGAGVSGTLTIFPNAQWLRTAAQETATTVDYIGE